MVPSLKMDSDWHLWRTLMHFREQQDILAPAPKLLVVVQCSMNYRPSWVETPRCCFTEVYTDGFYPLRFHPLLQVNIRMPEYPSMHSSLINPKQTKVKFQVVCSFSASYIPTHFVVVYFLSQMLGLVWTNHCGTEIVPPGKDAACNLLRNWCDPSGTACSGFLRYGCNGQ